MSLRVWLVNWAKSRRGDAILLLDVTDPAHVRPAGPPLARGGGPVLAMAFSPDGRLLASASQEGTTRLWDVANPARPQPFGPPLTSGIVSVGSVAFSPDGQLLASGSQDAITRLWDLDVSYAIGRICATAGGLTPSQWSQYIPQLPYRSSCPG